MIVRHSALREHPYFAGGCRARRVPGNAPAAPARHRCGAFWLAALGCLAGRAGAPGWARRPLGPPPRRGASHAAPPPERPDTPAGWPITTFRLWTTMSLVWTIRPHEVFSSHTRWTALPLVVRVPRANRSGLSSVPSPARAQGERRVCTGCPQTCAQRDWTQAAGRRRLSEPVARTDAEHGSGGSSRRPRCGEVGRHERR